MKSILICAALLAGCAETLPPQELVDARAAYQRAADGPATQVKPDALLTARQSLDHAESLFHNDGNAQTTRDAAYVAERKAEYAAVAARMVIEDRRADDAEKQTGIIKDQELRNARGELQSTQSTLSNTQQALTLSSQELTNERIARAAAEKKAAQALSDLQRIAQASVKQETRGTVITISGGVLFKTDESQLLPAAMAELNQIGDALMKDPDSRITVEGHTDSQGALAHNRDLSQRRAESVANYLVSRGIARDRIQSAGLGPDRPVSDNTSIEGRALNRRVEIVVAPSAPTRQ